MPPGGLIKPSDAFQATSPSETGHVDPIYLHTGFESYYMLEPDALEQRGFAQ